LDIGFRIYGLGTPLQTEQQLGRGAPAGGKDGTSITGPTKRV